MMFPELPRPLLFAHRGASKHAPENTWEAFDLGLCLGADILEMDVHLTRDNQVVVIHDPSVDRTTDGHGLVRSMTYAELSKLDAGYQFQLGRGDFRFRGRGIIVNRLVDTLQNFSRAAFNIEVKAPGMARQVLKVLEHAGISKVVLAAGNDQVMQELEAAKPGVPLGMSRSQCLAAFRGAFVGGVPEQYRGRALQIPPSYRAVPLAWPRVIKAAQKAGLEVHIWTVNQARQARALLARGVDGIISDDPGAIIGAIMDVRHQKHAH